MARDWGAYPWDVQACAPAIWVDRWRALRHAEIRAQTPPKTDLGEYTGREP